MNGPDLELQAAVKAVLSASAALTSLIGARLHQNVPPYSTWPGPYVTIGEGQNVPDQAECIDGSEIFLTMHVFTRENGIDFAPNKRIVAVMDSVLHDADLTLTDFRCVQITRDGSRFFVDNDSITVHGVATYRALVEPTV